MAEEIGVIPFGLVRFPENGDDGQTGGSRRASRNGGAKGDGSSPADGRGGGERTGPAPAPGRIGDAPRLRAGGDLAGGRGEGALSSQPLRRYACRPRPSAPKTDCRGARRFRAAGRPFRLKVR